MNEQNQIKASYKIRTHSNLAMLFKSASKRVNFEVSIYIQQNRFLKKLFEKKSDHTIESNPLLKILSKNHLKISDGQQIYNQIIEYPVFKSFFQNNKKMKYDLQKSYSLCTKFQLEVFQKGHVILKEGTPSNNKMYFIVVGKVIVTQRSQFNAKNKQIPSNKIIYVPDDIQHLLDNHYGQVVNELGPGMYFGERALIADQKQALRTASCIASTDVYLMTMLRDDSLQLLTTIQDDISELREVFQKAIPKFSSIASLLVIENIIYGFKEVTFNKDEPIINENSLSDTIYILLEGEVGIMKSYNNHQLLLFVSDGISLFGEESLFDDHYQYSIIAIHGKVKLLKCNSNLFQQRLPPFIMQAVSVLMLQRQAVRKEQLEKIIQQNKPKVKELDFTNLNNQQIKYFITNKTLQQKKARILTERYDSQQKIQLDSQLFIKHNLSPTPSDRTAISLNHMGSTQKFKKQQIDRKRKYLLKQFQLEKLNEKLITFRSLTQCN